MNNYVEAAKRIADAIEAEAMAMGDITFARGIWKAVAPLLPRVGGRPRMAPEEPTQTGWRCRIMLFGPSGELEADTMPEASPEAEPDVTCNTLGNAAGWLAATAAAFHAERRDPEPQGLDAATLERSILSLRVSLSRNAGSTWWRVGYAVGGEQWRAVVRVERATS